MPRLSSACSISLSGPISFSGTIQNCPKRNCGRVKNVKKVWEINLVCPMDCLFYRQYQLPCKHLWHLLYYYLTFFQVRTGLDGPHYLKTVVLKFTRQERKPNVENEIHDIIGGPDRGFINNAPNSRPCQKLLL